MTGKVDKKLVEEPAKPVRLRPRKPCPICQQPSQHKYHPFCSARCADVDLHRWLGGTYRVEASDQPDFAEFDAPGNGDRDRREGDE